MSQWIAIAALSAAVLVLVLFPLLRGASITTRRRDFDLAVYRDQLAEVDRDIERGVMTGAEGDGARAEIKRRILAAADTDAGARPPSWLAGRVVAATVALAVPAGAVALYGALGAPGTPDAPYTEQRAAYMGVSHQDAADMEAMVEGLAARLEADPTDADGWVMLGKSYVQLGRPDRAVAALRMAVEQGVRDPDVFSILGESLVAQGQGVGPDARQAFLATLESDPGNPRARFYLGLAQAQAGDATGALAIWKDLQRDTPPEAPWAGVLRDQMRIVSEGSGIDIASVEPSAPRTGAVAGSASRPEGTVRSDTNPLTGLSEEQRATVDEMVSRLEQRLRDEPGDGDGWLRLARSYRVMGRMDDAGAAFRKAVAVDAKSVEARMEYAEFLIATAPDDTALPAEFVVQMRAILDVEPDNGEALYYLGLAASQAGNVDDAQRHWRRLLNMLPEGAEERALLSRQIDSLSNGG